MLLEEKIKEIIQGLCPGEEVWFPCTSKWNCSEFGDTCEDCVTNRIVALFPVWAKEAGWKSPEETIPACGMCGLPMSKNPHPDAGKPGEYVEIGAVWECVPCIHKAMMSWAGRLGKANANLEILQKKMAGYVRLATNLDGSLDEGLPENTYPSITEAVESGNLSKGVPGVVYNKAQEDMLTPVTDPVTGVTTVWAKIVVEKEEK